MGFNSDFGGACVGEESQSSPLDQLINRMERDEFDLIAVGRALLSDAQWVEKIREGRMDELHEFNAEDLQTLS